jgi:hypothetical protein
VPSGSRENALRKESGFFRPAVFQAMPQPHQPGDVKDRAEPDGPLVRLEAGLQAGVEAIALDPPGQLLQQSVPASLEPCEINLGSLALTENKFDPVGESSRLDLDHVVVGAVQAGDKGVPDVVALHLPLAEFEAIGPIKEHLVHQEERPEHQHQGGQHQGPGVRVEGGESPWK